MTLYYIIIFLLIFNTFFKNDRLIQRKKFNLQYSPFQSYCRKFQYWPCISIIATEIITSFTSITMFWFITTILIIPIGRSSTKLICLSIVSTTTVTIWFSKIVISAIEILTTVLLGHLLMRIRGLPTKTRWRVERSIWEVNNSGDRRSLCKSKTGILQLLLLLLLC